MKFLNLLLFTFDDEFYVIENTSELEARERLIGRVGKQPSHVFSHQPDPLWGTVGKNEFRVWLNRRDRLRQTPAWLAANTTGSFRNISEYNNKVLLKIDFSISFFSVIGALVGTGAFLYGIVSLLRSVEPYQQIVGVAAFGFILRVCCDLMSLSDVNKTRAAILEAFKDKKITRVSKVKS